MALVIPLALTLSVSESVSIELSSTVTERTPLECASPSPATVASKFKVTSPEVPPPVKPAPATTDSMSPASFVNEITPVELLYARSPDTERAALARASV